MRIFKIKRPQIVKQPEKPTQSPQEYAEHLRNNATESEELFCKLLDQLRVNYKFQHPVLGYFADFYFPANGNAVIELDGANHKYRKAYDNHRDKVFRKHGLRVLRIPSRRLFTDADKLIDETKRFLRIGNAKRRAIARLDPGHRVVDLDEEFKRATYGI